MIPTPPAKLKIVGECFTKVGYSKSRLTPPKKALNKGIPIIMPKDIKNAGIL